MVIWIIGLSGSGKTYLAKNLYKSLKKKNKTFLVDGDEVRKYLTYKLKYSHKDRKKNSIFISDFCKYLEFKGFIVICSILSIFKKHQKDNRRKFNKYFQIYIKSDFNQLAARNKKFIYTKKNVVGKDMKFPEPFNSDITIKNKFDKSFNIEIKKILKIINARK